MDGEEVAVLVAADAAAAIDLAEPLRRSLHEVLIEVDAQEVSIRASIGIIGIAVGAPGSPTRQLLERADAGRQCCRPAPPS